jgi:hypothetical protein
VASFRSQTRRQWWARVFLWILGIGLLTTGCTTVDGTAHKSSVSPSSSASASADSNASSATPSSSSSPNTGQAPSSAKPTPSVHQTQGNGQQGGTHGSTTTGTSSGAASGGSSTSGNSGSKTSGGNSGGQQAADLADIALDHSATCSISQQTVLHIVKAQGWTDGPYRTDVTYSKNLSGPYVYYDGIDVPVNNKPAANPMDGWQWPCHELQSDGSYVDDPLGYYKLQFFDANTNQPKSEVIYFEVVA